MALGSVLRDCKGIAKILTGGHFLRLTTYYLAELHSRDSFTAVSMKTVDILYFKCLFNGSDITKSLNRLKTSMVENNPTRNPGKLSFTRHD